MKVLSHEEAIKATGVAEDADGYIYSAIHRPGSWEWQEGRAAQLRERLHDQGLRCEPDPEVHWRVRWVEYEGETR